MKSKGKIFLLDDDELIVSVLSKTLRKKAYELQAETDVDDVINKIKSFDPDIVLLDISMPRRDGLDILQEIKNSDIDTQVVMLTADGSAETAVKAMKIGAVDYLTKPFDTDEVKIVLNNIIEKEDLKKEVSYLRKAYSEVIDKDLIGESAAIKEVKAKIEKIAEAKVSTLLITGESGTGKEVVARHAHKLMYMDGTSRQAPFISTNCAAMPETLIESELFGHKMGSFTDAKSDKVGLFEQAKGGSLLLDEIGDMKPDLQTKLLRVLEERTFRRVGGNREIPVDVTVIATSNRNLPEAVEKGDFRKDLFFRLTPFYLHIAPLRERKEDIPLLAMHFLSYFSTQYNKKAIKGFTREAEEILMDAPWPGNVRELKNLIERLVVLENTELIRPEHLPKWLFSGDASIGKSAQTGKGSSPDFELPETGTSLAQLEKTLIEQALEKSRGNQVQAAALLGLTRHAFRHRMKKHGLL